MKRFDIYRQSWKNARKNLTFKNIKLMKYKIKGKILVSDVTFYVRRNFCQRNFTHTHTHTETQNDIIWTRLSFSQNSFKQKRLFSCDIQFKGLSSFASLILLLLVSVYPPFCVTMAIQRQKEEFNSRKEKLFKIKNWCSKVFFSALNFRLIL